MPSQSDGFLDVSRILAPASIAVVGASDRPGNFGGATVRRLGRFGFAGPVWPVNPKGEAVAGLAGFASVAALPGVPDLAVLAVPGGVLLDAVRDCIAHGIRAGIAYAGGLGEAGGAGAELERALAALCREAGFALCGPNCVGVINAALPATATFATALEEVPALRAGTISLVSQSGGIGTTAFSLLLEAGFPLRHMVSSGNEAVADFSDYLYAFACDEGTRVIIGYVEGLRDGAKFVRALAEARRRDKAVALIKAGASGASARAALAHTGALVGTDRVVDAVLEEMDVIRVHSVEQLVDVAALLAGEGGRRRFGRAVGLVTFGGGNGVLAADQCAQRGLATPPLGAACIAGLKPLLASVATAANPLDLTPTTAFRDELLAQLPAALGLIAAEPEIDELLVIVGTLAARANEIIAVIRAFARDAEKPVVVSWPSPPSGVRDKLAVAGIYCFEEPDGAVRAIARLAARRKAPPAPRRAPLLPKDFAWPPTLAALGAGTTVPEDRCHAVMQAAGLPVAAGALACDADGACAIAAEIGYPVALKAIGADVTHRAAAGLILLDVASSPDVRTGFDRLRARAAAIPAVLEGVLVQRMSSGRTELLVAASRDPLFGTMISCGSGGVLAELLDDVATARAPVGIEAARGMIERLRLRRFAHDGDGPLPVEAPAEFIARFSDLAAAAPWRRFVFEANPVKWTRAGVVAVDGLLVIEEA